MKSCASWGRSPDLASRSESQHNPIIGLLASRLDGYYVTSPAILTQDRRDAWARGGGPLAITLPWRRAALLLLAGAGRAGRRAAVGPELHQVGLGDDAAQALRPAHGDGGLAAHERRVGVADGGGVGQSGQRRALPVAHALAVETLAGGEALQELCLGEGADDGVVLHDGELRDAVAVEVADGLGHRLIGRDA